ncbi:MAG: DNA primase [Clostridia bacterium]|nr:DNA primase [Clostridia bacterium]
MPGRFPSEWLDELIQRADAVSIISAYTPLKKNGSKYWGLCPFHGEKTASFTVDPAKKLYYCFGCKAGGNLISFIREMEHVSFNDACKYLADLEHLPLPQMIEDPAYQKRKQLRDRLYECNREAARFYHENLFKPEGAESLQYLKRRGVDDAVIRRFGLGASSSRWDDLLNHLTGLGFTPEEMHQAGLIVIKEAEPATATSPAKPRRMFDMFRGRAMFPIIDQYGHVLGFGGRILGKGEPKYLNTSDTPIFNKRLGVYAANLLKKERNLDRVILVEGYMDVIALSQFGVHGVVATLGTALTPEQAQLLHRFAPKVYLSYDGDKAGQHAILRGLDILQQAGVPARVLDFPDGLDPDEFMRRDGPEAFEKLPVLTPETYRMRRLRDNYDLTTQEGKTEYAKACAPILRSLDPLDLENKLTELSVQTGFSREVLLSQLEMTAPTPAAPGRMGFPTKPRTSLSRPRTGASTDVASPVRTQEMILSILSTAQVPQTDAVTADDFTDPFLQELFLGISQGRSPSSLISALEDPEDAQRAARILMSPPARDTNELLQMLQECQKQLVRTRLENNLKEVTQALKSCAPEEKPGYMERFQELMREINRLQT